MDEQIQVNHNPLNGCRANELSVAKECRGAMVVSVKESQRLLLEEQKDRVDQFKVFGQVIELYTFVSPTQLPPFLFVIPRLADATYIVQSNKTLSPSALVLANGEEDAMSPDSRQKLLNEQSQQSSTDQSQVQIMNHEQRVELQSREVLHDLPATKDDCIVGNEKHGGLLESGHGRNTFNELEIARRVTDNLLKDLVENRP